MTIIWRNFAISVLVLLSTKVVAQEEPSSIGTVSIPDASHCTAYRSKKDGIPVYLEPDQTSGVLTKLKLGERVCYIGEVRGFAIVDWRAQELINERKGVPRGATKRESVFVRLVDLWQPNSERHDGKPKDLFSRAKEYFDFMRYGGVPDDVLGPFRPIIDPFVGEPECEAGKICERVREQQRIIEQRQAK